MSVVKDVDGDGVSGYIEWGDGDAPWLGDYAAELIGGEGRPISTVVTQMTDTDIGEAVSPPLLQLPPPVISLPTLSLTDPHSPSSSDDSTEKKDVKDVKEPRNLIDELPPLKRTSPPPLPTKPRPFVVRRAVSSDKVNSSIDFSNFIGSRGSEFLDGCKGQCGHCQVCIDSSHHTCKCVIL
jgi:hypothetical protein